MITLTVEVDTSTYDSEEFAGLFDFSLKTFQQWHVKGEGSKWQVEGDLFVSTLYQCQVDYTDELLLRCLISQIRQVLGDRFRCLFINDTKAEFTDDDLLCFQPEWRKAMLDIA
jgi:hypothetical protein